MAEWPAGTLPRKLILTANESCWAGRPFVDKIEITMGVGVAAAGQRHCVWPGRRRGIAGICKCAAQRSEECARLRAILWNCSLLQFDTARPAVQDARLRQAISLAIDRASIADVILQRQGMWLREACCRTGFPGTRICFQPQSDLPRAKELLAATGRELSRPVPACAGL